jgi:N-acyl-D-amino-acid deacylase
MADLFVRGGLVIDGSGSPAVQADVRVRNGSIVEVGHGLDLAGEEVLDADGRFVTPGFIDVHTHYDGAMWWDRTLDPSPQHGVTTVVTGNCAVSLAPIQDRDRASIVDMFCYIEDLPVSAVAEAVPWTWSSWGEFRRTFNAEGTSCNIAPMVGHNNLRLSVLGDESFDREATSEERVRLVALLAECMEEGAYGVSLSFVDSDSAGRRVPSRLASLEERSDITTTLERVGRGIVQYVPRFMRIEGFLKDIDKIDSTCRDRGIPQTFAPLPAQRRNREATDVVMGHIRALRAKGAELWPQVFDGSALLFAGMPAWAEMSQATGYQKRILLTDPGWLGRAREDWESTAFTLFPKGSVGSLLVSEVDNPDLARFEGGPFAQVLAAWEGHPAEVLARWVLESDALPCLIKPGSADTDFDYLGSLLDDEATLVGGSDAGAHALLFCGAGDTTLLLARHVRERGDLTLERAIHKLTGLAARSFGIRDRGLIAPGMAGDLTVFALEELHHDREQLVADLPGASKRFTRPAGGYRATVVGGSVTQVDGSPTGALPGRMLHSGQAPRLLA